MATIYRFIVEERTGGGSGRKPNEGSKGAGKKGRWVSVLGGEKGGVEHNRKMRAINPLLNKATGGAWEKSMRLGRAAAGLVQRNTETGKIRIGGPAIAIIIALIIQSLLKFQNNEIQKAKKQNTQNYKQLESGIGAVHSQYEITSSFWNGKITYNENK